MAFAGEDLGMMHEPIDEIARNASITFACAIRRSWTSARKLFRRGALHQHRPDPSLPDPHSREPPPPSGSRDRRILEDRSVDPSPDVEAGVSGVELREAELSTTRLG